MSPSIVIAVVIAISWEVEPFWVTEFIAFEIKVTFSTQAVSDQPDHLMQAQASLNDRRKHRQN